MNATEVEEFLEHYGVRGQKWGVRNSSRSSGGSKNSGDSGGNSKSSADSGSSGGPGSKSAKSKTAHLSNDDLKKVVERMRLDQQYAELSNPKKQGGKKYVSNMLKDSGNKLAGAIVATVATIVVARALGQYSAKSKAQEEVMKEGFKKTITTAAAARAAFPPPKI